MRRSGWVFVVAMLVLAMLAPALQAQVSVTIEKQIETGSDQTAVFDFPGVGMLGNGQSANYVFGPGGVSLVFEQPPDATWQAPTITCVPMGQVTATQTGPFEVTITDQSGGTSASTVTCTFVNRQAPAPPPAPATPAVWLALLALALLGAGLVAQRGRARAGRRSAAGSP